MTPPAPARASRPPLPARPVHRLDHVRHLLELLPLRLGFRLHESLTLVALRAPRHEVGVVARLDLPAVLGDDGPASVAHAATHLVADGAVAVVAVVHADEDDPRDLDRGLRPDPSATATRAAEVVREACEEIGPVDVWVVARGRYLGLDCRDGTCCPHGGRPVVECEGTDPGAAAGRVARLAARDGGGPAARRRPVLASRDLVGTIPPAHAVPRRSAAAARSRWADARLRCAGPADLLGWRERSLDTWRAALAAGGGGTVAEVAPSALGRLEAALDDRVVRDAVLLTMVEPGTDLPDALVQHAGVAPTWPDPDDRDDRDDLDAPDPDGVVGERVAAALRGLVDPGCAREPTPEVVDVGCALLEQVVAHGRSTRQAPALTLLALLAWWGGDLVRAGVLVERALGHDPGHRLAELLDQALGAGLPPGWVRRRC